MPAQIVITLTLLLSIIGISIWFYHERNTMSKLHRQTISQLEEAIYTNNHQVSFRNLNLNRYDFQRYNLDEALQVQREIII